MREYLSGRAGVVPVVIVLLLASLALSHAIARFGETAGVDFYHFWGVPVGMRLSGHTLGTPYRDGQRYEAVLRQYGATVNQPRLRSAQRFWSGPDYTASPLLYRAFSVVSDDYTFSLAVFRTLQILAFVGACLALGWLHRLDSFHLACFALVGVLGYQPLLSDLRVANVGALQFAALTAATALAVMLAGARSPGRRTGLAAALLAGLAALALCKPNVGLACLCLAAHLVVRHGARLFALAAGPAVVVTAGLLIAPCLYFGSWTVWQDWYRFVYGANPRMLVRSIESGNYSTPLVVATWLGANVSVVSAMVLALLVVSLVVAILRPRERTPRGALETARVALRRVFGDPHAAVAVGLVLTMAASPLSWVHYYLVLLLPALWLVSAAATGQAVPILAGASIVMSAGVAGMLLWGLGWPGAMPATIALSWVPLWAALLIKLRSSDAAAAAAAASEAAVAPRSRRRR